ncbi:tRNA pseudouridine(38-40) synthase TruA [Halobellus salinus]|uniref:tRNA pseudouridine synthase A n=1 Tax=Halobellus salinus TaxID=931585 RepID=A0A830EEA5_9EURY|nr:tRNA pseudouridine(38-40) synthase TruA [Halobellus salinus]GGI96759.1 tRNA pseudouridine(38-40) synthase TruA [Halobellus salinus]SMP13485.1 tRNA pseudouridine38-40 synthase [Halobellus salinus]
MRAFRIAYDGRPFHGYQRQPTVPTVEGAVFDALETLGVFARSDRDRPAGYAAAGRTDAGVSATAQTVAVECPEWCTPRALNGELPADIRAWASAPAPEGFHATHDATRRAYVYLLYAPDLDDDRAADAAAILDGEHDFHNLTTDDAGTARDLSIDLDRDGAFLRIRAAADGFPRHLVRRLASVVRGVGTGTRSPAWVRRLLGSEPVDGPDGVPKAPPEPLVLTDVSYPDLSFERDPEAAASAAEVFGDRGRAARVRARVAARLASVDGADPNTVW